MGGMIGREAWHCAQGLLFSEHIYQKEVEPLFGLV